MASTMNTFTNSYMQTGSVDYNGFRAWTSKHHYRTSSQDMTASVPIAAKTYAIPGYSGYIPGASDTPIEKTFTLNSREQFARSVYQPIRTTTVFPNKPNSSKRILGRVGGGLPDDYHTVSRFHGKTTIPITHPNIQDNLWQTSSSFSYVDQEKLRGKVYRKTSYNPVKAKKVNKRAKTSASGFVQNSTLFDGHGWLPIEKLHGDMKVSEYRNRFNPQVPFHPKPYDSNKRSLKKKQLVY